MSRPLRPCERKPGAPLAVAEPPRPATPAVALPVGLARIAGCTVDAARQVTAEPTAAAGIAITPQLRAGRLVGGWCLTHLPSGLRIPTGDVDDVHCLRLIAAMVADLDWTAPDAGQYAGEHQARIDRVVCEVWDS